MEITQVANLLHSGFESHGKPLKPSASSKKFRQYVLAWTTSSFCKIPPIRSLVLVFSVITISAGFPLVADPLVDNPTLGCPVVDFLTLVDGLGFWDGLSKTSVIQSKVPSGWVMRIRFMYPYRRA